MIQKTCDKQKKQTVWAAANCSVVFCNLNNYICRLYWFPENVDNLITLNINQVLDSLDLADNLSNLLEGRWSLDQQPKSINLDARLNL